MISIETARIFAGGFAALYIIVVIAMIVHIWKNHK